MADDTTASVGTALAQPVISFIASQINAGLPSSVANAITSQFLPAGSGGSGSSSGSGGGDSSVQIPAAQIQSPAANNSNASTAVGVSLAQSAIDYIRGQIQAVLPSQLANAITANFPSGSGGSGSTTQASGGVSLQILIPNAELRNFFAGLNNSNSST